jgi:tetratricopeptide (TPR) repeat protein
METYRLSSKLLENNNEYLIQTANESDRAAVATTIYVNGVVAERVSFPHPDEISPQDVLALVKSSHGDKKRELEYLLTAFRTVLEQGQPEQLYQLGTAFYYKSFYGESRELFRHAVLADEEHHQAWNYLALSYLALGDLAAAIESARRAVKLRPRYADYRNNLGEAYLASKDCEPAISEFSEAVEINMYYSDAYYNLALAYMLKAHQNPDAEKLGARLAKIMDYLNKAAVIYDGYRGDRFDNGVAALQQGDLAQALSIFRGIREAKRETRRQEFAGLHMKFLVSGERVSERALNERITYLRAQIDKNPTYVDLQADLAQCYFEQAKLAWQRGIDQSRQSLKLNPSLHRIRLALNEAEGVYEQISLALSRITEKG